MIRRAVAVLLALVLAGAALPAVGGADGDPASDVLLGENVFYPYTPAVAPAVAAKLNGETDAAGRAGFPIKVALIGSPTDLGVVPSVFGHPQQYADFLYREITFAGATHLLVVMAAGYGVQGVRPTMVAATRTMAKPAGPGSTALAQAAIAVVAKMASAAGHPLPGTVAARDTAGRGDRTVLLVALVVAAVLVSGGLIGLRARRRPGPRSR